MSDSKSSVVALVPIDSLDRAILNLSARMDAACYEQLVLIRQFDERGGWLKWAFTNCTEWLAWRCDLSLTAAREKVRVAHALKTLPVISAAFADGRLSYTKVRAMTRVASDSNEENLVIFALRNTAIGVEERCRELLCGRQASISDANNAHTRRSLSIRRNLSRGTLTINVELPLESGELVDKALDRLALVKGEGRSGLPVESVKRLCCDSETIVIVEDENEQPLSVGRKTRTVPTAIKRALWARDKGCAFPGCHRKRFVDAHHIHHWSAGGETSLKNLVLLCSRHHRLVHEGGYRILKDYRDQWCFKRPDGIAVPRCGYHANDMRDDGVDKISEPINNTSAEGLLTKLENPRINLVQLRPNGRSSQ